MTRSMRILFLDIASHQGTLACVSAEKTVAIRTIDHRISDGELLPVLEAVLKDAGWADTDITHIACVTGPGGFTSLRVGVAFANALAHTLKIPSASVHLSDLYAARVSVSDFIWLHSTKTTAMFIRGFGSFANIWPEPVLMSTDDLTTKLPHEIAYTGEAIETHRALLDEKKAKSAPIKTLEEILPGFLKNLAYEKALLQPWYGREG